MARWAKKWDVKGLHGTYKVSVSPDEQWGCSCRGWTTKIPREDCKHIRRKKWELKWVDGDVSNLIKLTAYRVQELKSQGKSDDYITADLAKIFPAAEGDGNGH